jgi:hypothetical protein
MPEELLTIAPVYLTCMTRFRMYNMLRAERYTDVPRATLRRVFRGSGDYTPTSALAFALRSAYKGKASHSSST